MNQRTYSRWVRPAAKATKRAHIAANRATRGRVGSTWLGGEVVLLTTTGRRSGRRRVSPLVCLRDDSAIAVVASNGGSDRYPDWWLNLQHDPRADIECSGTSYPTWATRAEPETETRLLDHFARAFPSFDRYRRRTTRELPVVLLRPRCANGTPRHVTTVTNYLRRGVHPLTSVRSAPPSRASASSGARSLTSVQANAFSGTRRRSWCRGRTLSPLSRTRPCCRRRVP